MKTSEKKLQDLGNPLRDVKKAFDESIVPHRPALWRFCYRLTGSPWDAEDLVQETLIKAFSSLAQLFQPINPRSYLFKIASNTWIDQCRKSKLNIESIEEAINLEDYDHDVVEIEAAMEHLVINLPPRQRVVLLMKDVFQFKSKEIGETIGVSEGAVKAILNRARKKIKQANETNQHFEQAVLTDDEKRVVELYMESFNRKDPDGIARLLDENVEQDIVHIAKEYGRETMRKYSLEDWSKDPVDMKIELHTLWGKPALVQIAWHEGERSVYDLNVIEIEDGKVVKSKDYYFCPELLGEAAKMLNLGVFPRAYTL